MQSTMRPPSGMLPIVSRRKLYIFLVMIRYRVAIGLLVCIVFTVYARDREVRLRAQFTRQLAVGKEGVSSTKVFLIVDVSNPQEPSVLDMN